MTRLRLLAVAALLGGALAGTAVTPAAADSAEPAAAERAAAAPAAAERAAADSAGPNPAVVVVGVPGLRWSDIRGPTPTPGLWLLARDSALAALSVRTAEATACPLDGWLTLNSGARSVGPRPGGECAPLPVPQGSGTAVTVPNWADLVAPNAEHSYDPVWGTLAGARPGADPTPDAERCAVGPGAAVALADATGRVRASYAADIEDLPEDGCADLLVVDAGAIPLGPRRSAAVSAADGLVDRVRTALPGSALMVAGIGDSNPEHSHLSALMVEPGTRALERLQRGWLRSESTRRTGIVMITDLTPTLLRGPVPDDLVGHSLQFRTRTGSTPTAVGNLDGFDVAAQTVRTQFVPLFVVLIAGQVLAYAFAAIALRRGRIGRRTCARVLVAAGLTFGAVPVASVLANLLPWRALDRPTLALWVVLVVGAAAIAALAGAGPWRRHPYGCAGAVAALTVAVLAADAINGSRLQLNALFGLSPLIAGRFYGFGNITFAVFAMCTLLTAAWAGAELLRRGRRRAAGAVVAGIGALAVFVDGWPAFGADFGGVLALLPGIALLAAGVAGVRVTVVRVLGVVALTAATVVSIAVLDWRRDPASRSHLGRFVADVLDGEGLDVIGRKAEANLGLLADAPVIALAALPLLTLVVLALFRPGRLGLGALARAQATDPALRPLLLAALCTALIGFAANDSGVIVPAVALITIAPLVVAVWARIWSAPAASPQQRPLDVDVLT